MKSILRISWLKRKNFSLAELSLREKKKRTKKLSLGTLYLQVRTYRIPLNFHHFLSITLKAVFSEVFYFAVLFDGKKGRDYCQKLRGSNFYRCWQRETIRNFSLFCCASWIFLRTVMFFWHQEISGWDTRRFRLVPIQRVTKKRLNKLL